MCVRAASDHGDDTLSADCDAIDAMGVAVYRRPVLMPTRRASYAIIYILPGVCVRLALCTPPRDAHHDHTCCIRGTIAHTTRATPHVLLCMVSSSSAAVVSSPSPSSSSPSSLCTRVYDMHYHNTIARARAYKVRAAARSELPRPVPQKKSGARHHRRGPRLIARNADL